jgi:ubiquinone/menaquinone biosynthesis C-methylase UbiE
MKQWYEELFTNYAETYDKESFTQGTLGEVDFIEQEINFDKTKRILDIGCGTGRHAIELTKRGYQVVGVDLSASQLKRAKEKTITASVKVDFIQKDARQLDLDNEFNIVIMICEGAFPLMETDEMNFQILQGATKALKKNGKFIFTTLNALFPLYHSVKDFLNENSGETTTDELTFDLMTFREHSTMTTEDDSGNKKVFDCNERYYAPSEITWLLKSLGFKKIGIHGCKLGKFSRDDKLTTDDFEMLVIAEL